MRDRKIFTLDNGIGREVTLRYEAGDYFLVVRSKHKDTEISTRLSPEQLMQIIMKAVEFSESDT